MIPMIPMIPMNKEECPKRIETAIRLLDAHLDHISGTGADPLSFHRFKEPPEEIAEAISQINRAIALLKCHESMCECGAMPNDGNAALWDLERSLATHKEMHTAFEGTPKGNYHLKCIREIEDALTILKNSNAPEEKDPIVSVEIIKTSNLTFNEALEAVKRGKTVGRDTDESTRFMDHETGDSYHPTVADMIATDWQIVG
jgi:hypothetical protein